MSIILNLARDKMKSPIIVVGIGEIGSVMARGFLRIGKTVIPVTRDMDLQTVCTEIEEPEAVIIAVGEAELHNVLDQVPYKWKSKLILIQNELLPRDWEQHDINPTVISVWFEKKKGQDVKVVVPSPIFGEKANLLSNALNALDIPTEILNNSEQLTFELVRKNYYILTSNIAGLKTGGKVGELWDKHQDLARSVVDDVHELQQSLVTQKLDKARLVDAMLVAFNGDPEHGCMGRSAPARLLRAIDLANQKSLKVLTFREIQNSLG
jgi:hypothetical protein